MMKKLSFEVEEKGKKINFIIIKFFKRNDINYIIYKEKDKDEIYASRYEIKDDNLILNEIENDDEWDYIDLVLEDLEKNE